MTAVGTVSRTGVTLEVRKELVEAIVARIEANGWTQAEAAQRLGSASRASRIWPAATMIVSALMRC